jgi:hypothetical protein
MLEHLIYEPKERDTLMRSELFATYLASSLLTCVLGFQFSGRKGVDPHIREIVDILFLSIAMFILFWAGCSYYRFVNYTFHRLGLLIIFLSTFASFIYLIYLSAVHEL